MRKSWDRFVIFWRKMINARHSFGICQTPKISNFARLKWTLPPSTEIIHSHIWDPPLTRATYLKHTSMLDNKGRRSDGTFKVANRILVWPLWDSLQIQAPSNMGHRQIEHSTVILPETETKNYSTTMCEVQLHNAHVSLLLKVLTMFNANKYYINSR